MPRQNDPDASIDPRDLPRRAETDWDGLTEPADPADLEDTELADELEGLEEDGDISEDDDDNPYQESDEALPDDEEEASISGDFDRSRDT